MGILDQVTGAMGGSLGDLKGGGIKAVLAQQVIAYLSRPGGLGNLTRSFQEHGLGNILQSWLGTGQNESISPSQVQQVLGQDTVADMASKAGVDASEASNQLSGLLPELIDKISPGGRTPSENDLGGLMSSMGKLFG